MLNLSYSHIVDSRETKQVPRKLIEKVGLKMELQNSYQNKTQQAIVESQMEESS